MYKSVKIPIEVYNTAKITITQLLAKGTDSLPEEVRNPTKCPVCGSPLDTYDVKMRIRYAKCNSCGYSQPIFDFRIRTSSSGQNPPLIGLGIIFGLAISALLYLLNNKKREVRPHVEGKRTQKK